MRKKDSSKEKLEKKLEKKMKKQMAEQVESQAPMYDIPDFPDDLQNGNEKNGSNKRKTALAVLGAILAVVVLIALILTISYNLDRTPESANPEDENVMMTAMNTVAITTAAPKSSTTTTTTTTEPEIPAFDENAGIMITENEDGSQLVNIGGIGSMMIPSEWKDRYVIRDNTFYSKECWKKKEDTGMLFSINVVSEDEIEAGDNWLLGTCESGYVMLEKPQDTSFSVSGEDEAKEYADMQQLVDDIAATAVCTTTPYEYNPMSLADFEDPANRGINGMGVDLIFDTWALDLDTWADESKQAYGYGEYSGADNVKPLLTFGTDGTMQYEYFGVSWGKYLLNTGENGSIYALAFYNGQVHQVTFTLNQDLIMDGMNSILDAQTYSYTSAWTFIRKTISDQRDEEKAASSTSTVVTDEYGNEITTETTTTTTVIEEWTNSGWDNAYNGGGYYDYGYDYGYSNGWY